jgi:phosphohistidine phosphatase
MIVTIWRHGEAGEAFADRRRELTGSGRDDIGFGCQQFHLACAGRNMPAPDLILHSPWVRTRQTAELIASAFAHATIRPEEALRPGSEPAAVDAALDACMESQLKSAACPQHVVLVSHQPLVSRLVDNYLGETGSVPPLSPGGLATLELDVAATDGGRLRFWALPPEYEASV